MGESTSAKAQILLVEDHVLMGQSILEQITRECPGVQVTWAKNYAEAAKALESQSFVAIITDQNFPEGPGTKETKALGLELTEQVRAGKWPLQRPDMPIQFNSLGAQDWLIETAIDRGATEAADKNDRKALIAFIERHVPGARINPDARQRQP
jgi:CheY-like chemotaxis protein